MLMALQAGASGLTFTPVPGLIGSDLMRVRDDFRTMADPFDPAYQVAVIPAITPDVALMHGLRALPDGSVVLPARGDGPLLAQAARLVIATVEEVCDVIPATIGTDEQVLPGIYVDVVVPAPRGVHPQRFHRCYGDDATHVRRYLEAARDAGTFAAYLRRYVLEPAMPEAYLALVDAERESEAARV